ncbi:Heterochromatin protein 1-binding protein 3 [Merluccius polli]|uniref:Heterochromatin protein 1-binding protein 3 n=1 Tax=Merluccius polli TaxID=89951 RepID=A0AA47LYY9_MERPO|nr:Heterochromatin protein 1-binding protein 3 [Merluccius polli]
MGRVAAAAETNGEGGAAKDGGGGGEAAADADAENEGHAMPTVANGETVKCRDCAEGQCATHCFVLLIRDKSGVITVKYRSPAPKPTAPHLVLSSSSSCSSSSCSSSCSSSSSGAPRMKDGVKLGKTKVKKLKRTIPPWASVSANKKIPVAAGFSRPQPKVEEVLLEAVMSGSDHSGMSYMSILKYMMKKYPSLELEKRKYLIKKALKKHLEKGTIKQLKGKGLAGSFAARKQPTPKASAKKSVLPVGMKSETLGDALPLIITRLCEPKEASYIFIKKYLEQHFPHLHNRPDMLKTALVRAVTKGHLERITGKGASGTFQLKRAGDKVLLSGGPLEDAISTAIIAMNEPKTCSTNKLLSYLCHAHQDSSETRIVALLRKTLTKCKMLGWMDQITGSGLSGTYRLAFPYYPRYRPATRNGSGGDRTCSACTDLTTGRILVPSTDTVLEYILYHMVW